MISNSNLTYLNNESILENIKVEYLNLDQGFEKIKQIHDQFLIKTRISRRQCLHLLKSIEG